LLPVLQKIPRDFGVLGAVLSGAGPSVLIFIDPKANASRVKAKVRDFLRRQKLSPELILTKMRDVGAVKSGGRKSR
jgi:homoserine kinase